MDQNLSNPIHMATISMQSQHHQANQSHYPAHGQYQQYYSDYPDSCYQSSAFADTGFPGEQFGYHSVSSVPYGSGIESYLDPKYAANPAAFASRLPYLPFHAAVAAYGMYDYSFEPAFIRKRNERERQRVKCVNEGYVRLREHLPEEYAEKRLSKVETLRGAIMYINELQSMLGFEPEKEKNKRKTAGSKNTESNKDKSEVEKHCELISSSDEKEDSEIAGGSTQCDIKTETTPLTSRCQTSRDNLYRANMEDSSLSSSREKKKFHSRMKQHGAAAKNYVPATNNRVVEDFSPEAHCALSPLECRLEEERKGTSPSERKSCEHIGSAGGLSSSCSDFRASPNWWSQTSARPHPTVLDFVDEFHIDKPCVRQSSEMITDFFTSTLRNPRLHPYRGCNASKSSIEKFDDAFLIKTETQTSPPYNQCRNFSNQRENYSSYGHGFSVGTTHNIFRSNSAGREGQSDGFKTDTSPESSTGLSP